MIILNALEQMHHHLLVVAVVVEVEMLTTFLHHLHHHLSGKISTFACLTVTSGVTILLDLAEVIT